MKQVSCLRKWVGMVVHLMIAHITQLSKGYCNTMRHQRLYMELVKIMVDKGISTNASTASMLIDLLSANSGDKALQELCQ